MSQPVLDTRYAGKQLRADPGAISYGRKSIALDEVEWLTYWGTHIATKRFMYPTTHHSEWHFQVGKYPHMVGQTLGIPHYVSGKDQDAPETWVSLVSLVKQHLEPRLLTDLVTRVHDGETVTVGGSVKVTREGITCAKPRASATWKEITRQTQLYHGTFWVYKQGNEKPILTVPQSHPNAVLMPALFATFMP